MIVRDYLIVGAGIGGAAVCESIREYDRRGSVMFVGSESHLPYYRARLLPSLLAKGSSAPAPALYRDASWYAKNKIDVRLDNPIAQFNIERRIAVLASGQAVQFKKACLAMGSRPRRPAVAGAHLGHVLCLRTQRDVLALREIIETEKEIVVVGGGAIAAEAAAVLRQLRVKVTLLCRNKYLWQNRLDETTAAWLTDYFESQGVNMMMLESLNGFEGKTVIKNVQTKSGERVAAGVALIATGVDPDLQLVLNTPLSSPHGVPVNEFLETDEKGIYAIGDLAYYPDRVFKGVRRLRHWENALAQGRLAGANITGKKRQKFDLVPSHSVRLFDLRIELVGDFQQPLAHAEIDGAPAKKRFTVKYSDGGKLTAVVLVNQDEAASESARQAIRAARGA